MLTEPGGIFSVALSVKPALSEPPRPLAGMLPYGDRTFLPNCGSKPAPERPSVYRPTSLLHLFCAGSRTERIPQPVAILLGPRRRFRVRLCFRRSRERLRDVGLLLALESNHGRVPGAEQETLYNITRFGSDRDGVTSLRISGKAVTNHHTVRALQHALHIRRIRTLRKQKRRIGLRLRKRRAKKKRYTQFRIHSIPFNTSNGARDTGQSFHAAVASTRQFVWPVCAIIARTMQGIAQALNRRRFIQHVLGSPFVAGALAGQSLAARATLTSATDALDVFDFMPAAQKNMSAAHWAYLMTGVDDDLTRDWNHEAFRLFQIRPRRFVDVERIDTSVEIFGQRYSSPILLDPVGSQRAFFSEGELATARAARVRGTQMILSTVTATSLPEVAKEYQRPLWFQLYLNNDSEITRGLIQKAERSGCPVLVVTVDSPSGGNRETAVRAGRRGEGECRTCHEPGLKGMLKEHPMFDGLDISNARGLSTSVTWELLDRIRASTRMKIVVKGIMTGEDARLSMERGLDGIVVSNHGGRQEETLFSTIEALPEIVSAVKGRIPILIDGGFRRGTDVFKALALGATAIGIGRPYIWGLGAFGQAGVEKILGLMEAELVVAMKQAGVTSISRITGEYVRRRSM